MNPIERRQKHLVGPPVHDSLKGIVLVVPNPTFREGRGGFRLLGLFSEGTTALGSTTV